MKICTICNQKGGVGKTTTAANLGCALAERGRKTILIDLDPQAALTISVGFDPVDFSQHMYHVLLHQVTLADITVQTTFENLELAPTNIDLCGIEAEMILGSRGSGPKMSWERTLVKAIEKLGDTYDIAIIDTPPTFGVLLTNALVAADLALIPGKCDYLSYRALEWLFPIIEDVQEVNPEMTVRIVRTMHDKRTIHSREVAETTASKYPDITLHTLIKHTVRTSDATLTGKPVVVYDPESDVAKNYRQIADEVEGLLR